MPSIATADTSGHAEPRADANISMDVDDFGLPVRKQTARTPVAEGAESGEEEVSKKEGPKENGKAEGEGEPHAQEGREGTPDADERKEEESDSGSEQEFRDAAATPAAATPVPSTPIPGTPKPEEVQPEPAPRIEEPATAPQLPQDTVQEIADTAEEEPQEHAPLTDAADKPSAASQDPNRRPSVKGDKRKEANKTAAGGVSEWSHQGINAPEPEAAAEDDEWQTMPAYAPFDMYDDDNRRIAVEYHASDDEADAYAGLGGAGKGYTRLQLDEDAQSATSLDENTKYLFKDVNGTGAGEMENEEQRDALSQMQATKDLLTEGQRIAYVGMTRIILSNMVAQSEAMLGGKGSKKELQMSSEAMRMWSQKMMFRLYAHMEISTDEQIMIEQLAEHGVVPEDLKPTLMQNARVKNPMAAEENAPSTTGFSSPRDSLSSSRASASSPRSSHHPVKVRRQEDPYNEEPAPAPIPYEEHEGEDLPEVRIPDQLPTTKNIDIDLRWTVLCDLFLTLIADSVYDARSRVLLENVGQNLGIDWLEICRFEKRVTDALEMQQAAEKENWNEDEHKETRRKMALKKRYLMMGLATVGGSLVIGLSAGLLAPVIGAGLAAGFTTIGVAGTSGFLAGTAGAAIITTGAATSGGIIAVRAADRRTGAVKTFEYRPLHNNKRVNLIITVSGWMTGKVDDVRLPYSTVDPIMGDIYSVLWEPEMLQSMGDTINILATEALTQGLQQVLGSTILIGLMAALQLPVVLTKLAYLIDNPWTVSLDRANAAGLILADSLIDRNLGTRPITFVGYSLGSRVIFSCLRELAKKGAYGLVQNVYLFGAPIVAKKDEYLKARSVVAGRFVNGYAKNDWILGYLFRLTSGGISRVAGLAPVEEIPGLENVDVTEFVPGHMAYRTAMPRLLREVGWSVENDTFTEIEDPDPENHTQRQRELINEIEEARKEFEKKEKEGKGKFGFFRRKKKTVLERQEWETYEESKGAGQYSADNDSGMLFDADAMRAELATEHMEVKELKSTLPPMKLNLDATSPSPRSALRATQSFDAATMLQVDRRSPIPSPRGSPHPSNSGPSNHGSSPRRQNSDEYEEEVQMTFDTAYHSPALSTSSSFQRLHPAPLPQHQEPASTSPSRAATSPVRPELKTSSTLPSAFAPAPAPVPEISLNRNSWADEDEDFGQEREMEMTFA